VRPSEPSERSTCSREIDRRGHSSSRCLPTLTRKNGHKAGGRELVVRSRTAPFSSLTQLVHSKILWCPLQGPRRKQRKKEKESSHEHSGEPPTTTECGPSAQREIGSEASEYGCAYLVTDSWALVPVEGRTSALQYGHVRVNQGSGLLYCHVAKGKSCSEFLQKGREGGKVLLAYHDGSLGTQG
jgi:hypothetical protein